MDAAHGGGGRREDESVCSGNKIQKHNHHNTINTKKRYEDMCKQKNNIKSESEKNYFFGGCIRFFIW